MYASEYYKEDFYNYNDRLGSKGTDIDFAAMVPALWLPQFMQVKLGYDTHARVSLPVLNPKTGINRGFDSFQLMDSHNDMRSMADAEPRFAFEVINGFGESALGASLVPRMQAVMASEGLDVAAL